MPEMTPEYRKQIAEMLAQPYPTVAAETSVSALLAAARALLDELVQCETQLAETSADGAQWQARAETAERELAEVREQWPLPGPTYDAGWADALRAVRMPGLQEREAAWRKFCEAAGDVTPQQPEDGSDD